MIHILTLGDITDARACSFIKEKIAAFRRESPVDLVVANGENAGFIMGPHPTTAEELFAAGIDCLTGGNHTMQNKLLYPMLAEDERLLRPQNYPPTAPGSGAYLARVGGVRILVLNVQGQVFMEPALDSPFTAIDRVLSRYAGDYDISVLDIHAEATGEKLALAHYLDGRVSAVFGTHTHVQTADECILPSGTGYISDIGMCGAVDSVLGVKKEAIIERYLTRLPVRPEPAQGPLVATGAYFSIDESSGKCTAVRRVRFEE